MQKTKALALVRLMGHLCASERANAGVLGMPSKMSLDRDMHLFQGCFALIAPVQYRF
jgi:hypothetical protein